MACVSHKPDMYNWQVSQISIRAIVLRYGGVAAATALQVVVNSQAGKCFFPVDNRSGASLEEGVQPGASEKDSVAVSNLTSNQNWNTCKNCVCLYVFFLLFLAGLVLEISPAISGPRHWHCWVAWSHWSWGHGWGEELMKSKVQSGRVQTHVYKSNNYGL